MEEYTIDQYNQRVNKWVRQTRDQLKQSISRLSMKGKGELMRSLTGITRKDFGEIESVVYHFNRYGVFFHKGVGRGYTMVGGTVVKGHKVGSKVLRASPAKTVRSSAPRNSFRSGGSYFSALSFRMSRPRQPKEWFNPILDKQVPDLANMVAEMRADMTVKKTAMIIK